MTALDNLGAGVRPPIFIITDDDHGGFTAVSVYTLLALSVFVVATRLSARFYISRVVQLDDYLLAGATILGLIQSVFVQLAISHGLGKKQDTLSPHDLEMFQKYWYVAQILFVATIALSKLSIGLLFKNLMSKGVPFIANWTLIATITAWAVASMIALAARCSSPRPWDFVDGKCINQVALFHAISAINIITDLGLVILPCVVLWAVQVSTSKRVRIIGMLSIRLTVLIAVAFETHYYNVFVKSDDKTWTAMNVGIWDQAVMNMSIIATSIPSLGRLAVELQPNVGAFAMTENHGVRSRDKYTTSSIGNNYSNQIFDNNGLGMHTSVQSSVEHGDTESMEGLVRDGMYQNVVTIQHTIDFKVE